MQDTVQSSPVRGLSRRDFLKYCSYLTAVIGTDAVYHGEKEFRTKHPWFKEVSIASYFAKVIYKLNHRESLSELLK